MSRRVGAVESESLRQSLTCRVESSPWSRARCQTLDSKLVSAAHEVPLVVVVSRAARRSNTDALENAGAEVIVATGENEPARVRSALILLSMAVGIAGVVLLTWLGECGRHYIVDQFAQQHDLV